MYAEFKDIIGKVFTSVYRGGDDGVIHEDTDGQS